MKNNINEVIRCFQNGIEDSSIAADLGIDDKDFTYLLTAYRAVGEKDIRASWNKRPMMRWLRINKNLSNKQIARIFQCTIRNVQCVFGEYAADKDDAKKRRIKEKELQWLQHQNRLLQENEKNMDAIRKKTKRKVKKPKEYITLENRVSGSGVVFSR